MSLLSIYEGLFHTDDDVELGRRSRQLIEAIATSDDQGLRTFLAGAGVIGSSAQGLWSAYVAIRFARALSEADEYMLDDDGAPSEEEGDAPTNGDALRRPS